jgi:hypothetical protein
MAGYSKLAVFMAEKRHAMVRKYHHLAIRDLLYLQAEICYLEHEYDLISKRDASEKDERQYYNREWWFLENSKCRGFDGEQWAMAMKIREKLREYCMFRLFLFQDPYPLVTFNSIDIHF